MNRYAFVFALFPLVAYGSEISHQMIRKNPPLAIHILEVDPEEYEIFPVRALDLGFGRESVLSLTKRYGAVAGVNGGFFAIGGLYDGISRGILKINQEWYASAAKPRGAIGWKEQGREVLYGRVVNSAVVEINGHQLSIPAPSLNSPRSVDAMMLYSSSFSFTTLTEPNGVEVVIQGGKVKEMRESGSSCIPEGGWVLSCGDNKKSVLDEMGCEKGVSAHVEMSIMSQLDQEDARWNAMDHVVGGTPLLVHEGSVITDFSSEKTLETFLTWPHARTAVGLLPNGHWIFVAVDGKQPGYSLGMKMHELASFMKGLGCIEALNLDGGGSTTMVFEGKVVNRPVGDEDEGLGSAQVRRVSDAILIRKKH